MITNIDHPILIILFVSMILFTFISFIKSAFATIGLETLYLWKKENRLGIKRLENLVQKQNQSNTGFAILKFLSLTTLIASSNIYYIKETPLYSSTTIIIINIVTILIIGMIETINHSLTKKRACNRMSTIPIICCISDIITPFNKISRKNYRNNKSE